MSRRAADKTASRLVLLLLSLCLTQGLLAAWLAHRALFSMQSFNDFLLEAREHSRYSPMRGPRGGPY